MQRCYGWWVKTSNIDMCKRAEGQPKKYRSEVICGELLENKWLTVKLVTKSNLWRIFNIENFHDYVCFKLTSSNLLEKKAALRTLLRFGSLCQEVLKICFWSICMILYSIPLNSTLNVCVCGVDSSLSFLVSVFWLLDSQFYKYSTTFDFCTSINLDL